MEKAAFTLYIIVLLFSPLAFGAVPVYANTFMSIGVLAGSLLLLRANLKKDHKRGVYQFSYPVTGLNLLFLGFLVFLVLQIIPLPHSLLRIISPEAAVIGPKSLQLSAPGFPENPGSQWFHLAPYAFPVQLSISRWTVYCLFFLGLIQTLTTRKRIELTVFLIMALGCFEVLYGLAQTYSGTGYVWWYNNPNSRSGVSGTYIGHNHFAGLMEMILVLSASFATGLSGGRRKRTETGGYRTSLRARLARFFSLEQRYNKRTLVLFAGVTFGVGLVFSASRGGLLAGAGGLFCLGLLYSLRKSLRKRGIVILFLFLMTAVYALHMGMERPMARFDEFLTGMEIRERFARNTLDLFRDYKPSGVGLGNFQYAYPKYQDPRDGRWYVNFAHNDWAQFLAEAGIGGIFLLAAGITYYGFKTLKLWSQRGDPFALCLGVMPLAAMTAVGIHSFVDFNLHIPANFLMLSALTAVGFSALNLVRHHGREKSLMRYRTLPLRYRGALVMSLMLIFIIWIGSTIVRHFVAECYCATTPHISLNRDMNPPQEEIRTALSWNDSTAQYWWKLAWEMIGIRDGQSRNLGPEEIEGDIHDRSDLQMEIIRVIETAVRLNPLMAEYHLQAGWEYARLREAPDYQRKWLPAADRSMERAAYFAGGHHPAIHEGLGNYWVMRSKTLQPYGPEWDAAWARARWHYQKAISVSPNPKALQESIRENIWNLYPDEMFVEKVLG